MRAPFASAIAAIAFTAGTMVPAQAGPTEVALLSSYIGEWSGAGVLEGGKEPQPFRCRLTIDKGNQAKINYAGRCTLVNMNLSVSGTIAYDDETRSYQAIMGSNAGFTGTAPFPDVGTEESDLRRAGLHRDHGSGRECNCSDR